ncbi:transcriptional regulator, TetR family [Cognatiyoonia sediminum]|uniref:Transcriptional regulator, TetR family n=1 Tax=Cognatiyoonia sediminum TaxID=1508389 RepID=A0A1M5QUL8_9RHOB|nr:TetR/AcrR family transcriptional regulator [Cognatiyoonia sediminum]SHH17243.1 transcriptional regulator, TetR family [Cognatiyoonia sediminum]
MARPREFEMESAMEGAMTIFWRQGFRATNLPELLDAMGLTRGSFYKAFEDKESVYLGALDRYDEIVITQTLEKLQGSDAPTASACLEQIFLPSATSKCGCFICNAMVELGPDNPKVAAKTKAMAARLKSGIVRVLEHHGIGETPQRRDELGDVVLHLYFGHQAVGKSGAADKDWGATLKRILGESD